MALVLLFKAYWLIKKRELYAIYHLILRERSLLLPLLKRRKILRMLEFLSREPPNSFSMYALNIW